MRGTQLQPEVRLTQRLDADAAHCVGRITRQKAFSQGFFAGTISIMPWGGKRRAAPTHFLSGIRMERNSAQPNPPNLGTFFLPQVVKPLGDFMLAYKIAISISCYVARDTFFEIFDVSIPGSAGFKDFSEFFTEFH